MGDTQQPRHEGPGTAAADTAARDKWRRRGIRPAAGNKAEYVLDLKLCNPGCT